MPSHQSVKYRISNVLAWAVSPFIPCLFIPCLFVGLLWWPWDDGEFLLGACIFGLWIWLPLSVVNYVMVGSLRILPWRDMPDLE